MNWYSTCIEQSCHLLELGIYKERADIEVIKSSLFIEKNSTADCWGVKKNLEPQIHWSVISRCFYSSRKYVYQYGDATAVVQRGSEQNPIFHLFYFTQNNPHNYYNCNFKKQFLTKSLLLKGKGDCLFYVVELDYLYLCVRLTDTPLQAWS